MARTAYIQQLWVGMAVCQVGAVGLCWSACRGLGNDSLTCEMVSPCSSLWPEVGFVMCSLPSTCHGCGSYPRVVGSMVTWAGCSTPMTAQREMCESMSIAKMMQIPSRFGKLWLNLGIKKQLCPGPYIQHVVTTCANSCRSNLSLCFCSATFSNEHLTVGFEFTY